MTTAVIFYEFLAAQNLSTRKPYYEPHHPYLGFKLRTPLVPSASPLSQNLDNIQRMEDAGASAVVLHSLFEEQSGATTTSCSTISNRDGKLCRSAELLS